MAFTAGWAAVPVHAFGDNRVALAEDSSDTNEDSRAERSISKQALRSARRARGSISWRMCLNAAACAVVGSVFCAVALVLPCFCSLWLPSPSCAGDVSQAAGKPNEAILGEWNRSALAYTICVSGVTPPSRGHARSDVDNSSTVAPWPVEASAASGLAKSPPPGANVSNGMPIVFTVETRIDKQTFYMPGVAGVQYFNLGVGHEWCGFKTKIQLYHAKLKDVARVHPRKYVILADGGDVGFGGCGADELFARYQQIVHASGGAPVVVGGDPVNYPCSGDRDDKTMNYEFFDCRASAVRLAFGAKANPYPIETRYVNSGFIMGPVSDVLTVASCQLSIDTSELPEYDDQYALKKCMFAHPRLITIDYSGLLVLRTWWDWQTDRRGILSRPKVDIWPLSTQNGRIANVAYGAPYAQCFMHFPGHIGLRMPNALGQLGVAEACGPSWMPCPRCSCSCCGAVGCFLKAWTEYAVIRLYERLVG